MAFKLTKEHMARLKAEKSNTNRNVPRGTSVNDLIIMPDRRVTAIRFCSAGECALWQGNRQLADGLGAGYELSEDNQRNRLIAVTAAARAQVDPPERLLILRNAPPAGYEHYTFYGVRSFNKIHAVKDGNTTMVSWIDITEMSDQDVADLVIAVTNEPDIMNG